MNGCLGVEQKSRTAFQSSAVKSYTNLFTAPHWMIVMCVCTSVLEHTTNLAGRGYFIDAWCQVLRESCASGVHFVLQVFGETVAELLRLWHLPRHTRAGQHVS